MTPRARPDASGPEPDGGDGRPDPATGPGPGSGPARSTGAQAAPHAPGAPPDRHGLSAAEVRRRVERGEVNDVRTRSSRSALAIVRANVFTRFNAIIGTLFLIILVVGPIQDGLFGFVIVANTAIGIVQELRAKATLDRLAIVGAARPTVRRDGTATRIPTAEVVLGDLVQLAPGDKCVVDGEVVEADGLEVDESLLTGEADPVAKQPGDRILSGGFVVAGGGAFTATKVGRDAYAARLAEDASRFTLVRSELRDGVSRILRYITYMMIPAALGLVVSQLVVQRHDWPEAVRRTVAGIVPMVPEGLVLLTSVAFAVGVVRLGRRRCLVQELPAIEGLARVDVVCVDKTGTLTEGGMDVGELRTLNGADEAAVRRVLGALGGADPHPNASLRALAEAFPDGGELRQVDLLPFSSARKYSGATFEGPDGGQGTWLLGAPDVLLPAGAPDLTEVDRLNTRGLRVLLLAGTGGALDAPDLIRDVSPTALVALEQRLRPDAEATLRYFAEQDVEVKVVSGDNAVAVGAVAGQLGLPGAGATVDARALPSDRDAMGQALDEAAVFGRVTPDRKRDMVSALRSRGHTAAMTGDGVNDVLALKDADIGVAMGSGSEATRAVAQIVLLDNRFSTLPWVVAEGRRVIGNITRVATLFLTKTVYSVLLAVLVVCAQVPYPFLPRHLTLLSTLTIGVPAFFLALAPNTERARPGFVRRVMRYAVPAGLIAGLATFATYLLARHHYAGPGALGAETSSATLALFLIAMWVLTIVARPFTRWRVMLVAAMGLAFALVLVTPWLQHFFALRLVGARMPWTAAGIALLAGLALEFTWRRVAGDPPRAAKLPRRPPDGGRRSDGRPSDGRRSDGRPGSG